MAEAFRRAPTSSSQVHSGLTYELSHVPVGLLGILLLTGITKTGGDAATARLKERSLGAKNIAPSKEKIIADWESKSTSEELARSPIALILCAIVLEGVLEHVWISVASGASHKNWKNWLDTVMKRKEYRRQMAVQVTEVNSKTVEP